MDTPPENINPEETHIDPSSFLLPKKEVQKVQSTQRASAGVLLKQEQEAHLEPVPKPPPKKPQVDPKPLDDPKATSIKSLETYQGDIEKYIQEKKVSAVTVAAAQEQKRSIKSAQSDSAASEGTDTSSKPERHLLSRSLQIAGGVVLVLGTLGLLAFLYLRSAPVSAPAAAQAPFIFVDTSSTVTLSGNNLFPTTILAELEDTKNTLPLSVGLVAQLVPVIMPTSTNQKPETPDAQTFLNLIAPDIPPTLLRDINPVFLLGLHSYDTNQPFLILSVQSYEQAYAGMLAWEPTMQQDLEPFFTYTPAPTIESPNISTSTTATSTATSTPQVVAPIGFTDQIVDNHDARVIEDASGNITLLWTFLDRNTVVITTNQYTLNEIISRTKIPPITPSTGQ